MSKVIVGAGGTRQTGWLSLERGVLDIRDRDQWARLFAPASLEAVLCEHVLEHLSIEEGRRAAANVYEFLQCGGYWRIAVPDANNPSQIYRNWSKPLGGWQIISRLLIYAPDEPTHKVFYNLESLTGMLNSVGFEVRPLEYYTPDGRLELRAWSQSDGAIRRSCGTTYTENWKLVIGFDNTSLLVDAIKPCP